MTGRPATVLLTDNNQFGRLRFGRLVGLQGAAVVARHVPSGVQDGYRAIHLLRVGSGLVRHVQMRLELLQRNGVRPGNPLVDGVVVEVPLQNDSRVPWIRLKVAVQNEGLRCVNCVLV